MSSTRKYGATGVPLLVDRLSRSYLASWRRTPDTTPTLGRAYTPDQQQANGEYCDEFLVEVENALIQYPTDLSEQDNWRRQISVLFREFCKRCLGYSDELLQVLFTEQNLAATRDFVHRARAFDENVAIDDLHQALRNVWVMNSIQFLLGREVSCSSSVFAYSMLYPYTDNYLDDTALSTLDKHTFNHWLENRLKGTLSAPRNPRETSLCRLVSCIEGDHSRRIATEVYDSLLAIHAAQNASLMQQSRKQDLSEHDLLEISIRKGGTSVLAHGYLVNRTITERDAAFFFGYGVFLQLLDDLQDVVGDTQRQHATVFTKVSGRHEPLDRLTSRVYHFMLSVLENATRFSPPKSALMQELISKNCGLLMLQAIAQHHCMFSRDYIRQLEPYSPLPFSNLCQSPERMQRVLQNVKRGFAQRNHDASIYDVLG